MSAALAIGQRAWVSARILWGAPITVKFRGVLQALLAALLLVALISWNPADPSLNAASGAEPTNWLGLNGALFADLFMQSLGLAAWPAAILLVGLQSILFISGNMIQPRMQGDNQNIDPVAVLLSLALWGQLWGVVGMFLSTPLAVMAMAILAEFKGSRWMAILLSGDGEPYADEDEAAALRNRDNPPQPKGS